MMTEPDLITLEDNVCVDDASLIGHMNTKGAFSLNCSLLQRGATMRTMSRLLAGATLEPEATLLEHTLVYAGDAVPSGDTNSKSTETELFSFSRDHAARLAS